MGETETSVSADTSMHSLTFMSGAHACAVSEKQRCGDVLSSFICAPLSRARVSFYRLSVLFGLLQNHKKKIDTCIWQSKFEVEGRSAGAKKKKKKKGGGNRKRLTFRLPASSETEIESSRYLVICRSRRKAKRSTLLISTKFGLI